MLRFERVCFPNAWLTLTIATYVPKYKEVCVYPLFLAFSTGANRMVIRKSPGLWGEMTMQRYAWDMVVTTPNF